MKAAVLFAVACASCGVDPVGMDVEIENHFIDSLFEITVAINDGGAKTITRRVPYESSELVENAMMPKVGDTVQMGVTVTSLGERSTFKVAPHKIEDDLGRFLVSYWLDEATLEYVVKTVWNEGHD